MNAIDTNVQIYSLDADEVDKQPVAEALLGQLASGSDTVLLWQVACEFLSLRSVFVALEPAEEFFRGQRPFARGEI